MDIDILVTGGVGLVTTIVGSWASWFFARKKYNSEVDNLLISNMKESLDFYKTLSDDNKTRLDEVLTQNKEILEQNAELLQQNAELKKEINELKIQVEKLTKERYGTKTKKNSI